MTIHEVLNILKNKDFHGASSFSPAERLIRETEFTDILQSLIDWGNAHVLKSFRYGLNMEDNVGEREDIDYC